MTIGKKNNRRICDRTGTAGAGNGIGPSIRWQEYPATYDRFLDVNERLVDGANEIRSEAGNQVAHYRAMLLYPDR